MQATQIANNANGGGNNGGNHGENDANGGGNNGGKNGGNNGDNNNPRHRRNRRTPDDASFDCQEKSNYCHTHVARNQHSGDCNRQAPGHKTRQRWQTGWVVEMRFAFQWMQSDDGRRN